MHNADKLHNALDTCIQLEKIVCIEGQKAIYKDMNIK